MGAAFGAVLGMGWVGLVVRCRVRSDRRVGWVGARPLGLSAALDRSGYRFICERTNEGIRLAGVEFFRRTQDT